MSFNPFKEKGKPIEKQIHNWSQLNVTPYNKNKVHPYTRTRAILMNGIEAEAVWFSHQFARHCDDLALKQKLALSRRIEQQQQKMINWLPPADESALEVTIGYEQVAVDLTAYLARTEPDPAVKAALDFALLEDFDHLYRYANLLEMTEGIKAEKIVNDLTEITIGRPTMLEHRHPLDEVRRPYDDKSAELLTKLHVLTIVAGEQQTMNFYMNVGNRSDTHLGRGLYAEIGLIEEQHVSHYESLADPSTSWFEQWILHEYNECYLYYSCMETETDSRIKEYWRSHLEDELEHLRIASSLMKQYENKDPEEMYPEKLPELTIFQSNKDYIREVLASQIKLTSRETEYIDTGELPDNSRYHQYQKAVNAGGVPSQQVIEENIRKNGRDYRLETEGPHPVKEYRAREKVTA
jgi:hypothetical protein